MVCNDSLVPVSLAYDITLRYIVGIDKSKHLSSMVAFYLCPPIRSSGRTLCSIHTGSVSVIEEYDQ